jgi:hypothetical protein
MRLLGYTCLLAMFATLTSGCGLKVGVPQADAASDSLSDETELTPFERMVGGTDQRSGIQTQLINTYSRDSMADFIKTNAGERTVQY